MTVRQTSLSLFPWKRPGSTNLQHDPSNPPQGRRAASAPPIVVPVFCKDVRSDSAHIRGALIWQNSRTSKKKAE